MKSYTTIFVEKFSMPMFDDEDILSKESQNYYIKENELTSYEKTIKNNTSQQSSKNIIPLKAIFDIIIDYCYNNELKEIEEDNIKELAKKYKNTKLNDVYCALLKCCAEQYILDHPEDF